MRIRSIEFAGIRVYSDNRRVEFGDNINILVGRNRAGKSSLQDALVIGLFGLGKQSERLNRSFVWSWTNPNEFRTVIQYQVNNRLFQIERDFTGATNQIELYTNEIANFQIPDISLKSQQKIVDEIKTELDKQEEMKKKIETQRNKIDEIIKKAVI